MTDELRLRHCRLVNSVKYVQRGELPLYGDWRQALPLAASHLGDVDVAIVTLPERSSGIWACGRSNAVGNCQPS